MYKIGIGCNGLYVVDMDDYGNYDTVYFMDKSFYSESNAELACDSLEAILSSSPMDYEKLKRTMKNVEGLN